MKKSLLIWFLLALGITLTWCETTQNSDVTTQLISGTDIENEMIEEITSSDITVETADLIPSDSNAENLELDPAYTLRDLDEINAIETEKEYEPKILVLYFSRADENYSVGYVDKWNTKFLAEYIAKYLDADMFEIEPVIPYPVDYDETTDIAKKELNDNARPEYKWNVNNWSDYDTIFLWYPIRWWDLPMVVYTFIESHDFSWKNIYLFNTHEWSWIAWTYNSLKNKLTTANVNTDGLPMRWSDARNDSAKWEVEKWLQKLWF